MMKRGAGLLRQLMGLSLGGLLLACAPTTDTPGLRDMQAPISSQVDVTAERLGGAWVIRRSWPGMPYLAEPGADRRIPDGGDLRLVTSKNGLQVSGQRFDIDDAGVAGFESFSTVLSASGNGRFRETGGKVFAGKAVWVLWMDADNRTAAIGTPGGEFGWIMDRRATGGQDRLKAASEIMQWMGYDMEVMRKGSK